MIKSAEIFGLNILFLNSVIKKICFFFFLVLVFIFSTFFHERQKLFQGRGKCNITSNFLSRTSFDQPVQQCNHQRGVFFFSPLSLANSRPSII